MIKINTLTEEEIDNIPICEIDLSRRTLTVLMNTHYRDNIDNSEIKTLLDLKNYVSRHKNQFIRVPRFCHPFLNFFINKNFNHLASELTTWFGNF